MFVSSKALLGSLLVVITYLFWFGYVYVLQNDLFFFHPWLDIPLHITGGFILALVSLLVMLMKVPDEERGSLSSRQIFWAIYITLVVGVFWEYYEYWFKLYETNVHLTIDTLSDIGNDFIGGVLAVGAYLGISKYLAKKHR